MTTNAINTGSVKSIKKGKYKHYKGGMYEVIDTVTHSEDESTLVLYRPLYGAGNLWVRPYDMFVEDIDTPQGVVSRFTYVGNE